MEILRRRSKSSICDDDLAPIKAAAWAWFQHGSGSAEASHVRESQVSRAQSPPPRPSRYKVEAVLTSVARWSQRPSSPSSDEAKSLLDSYETERISKQLGQYLAEAEGRSEVAGLIPKTETSRFVDEKRRKSGKLLKGLLAKHAVTCGGSSRDVDERAQRLLPRGMADQRNALNK